MVRGTLRPLPSWHRSRPGRERDHRKQYRGPPTVEWQFCPRCETQMQGEVPTCPACGYDPSDVEPQTVADDGVSYSQKYRDLTFVAAVEASRPRQRIGRTRVLVTVGLLAIAALYASMMVISDPDLRAKRPARLLDEDRHPAVGRRPPRPGLRVPAAGLADLAAQRRLPSASAMKRAASRTPARSTPWLDAHAVEQVDQVLGGQIAGRAGRVRAAARAAGRRVEAGDAVLQPGHHVGQRGAAGVMEVVGELWLARARPRACAPVSSWTWLGTPTPIVSPRQISSAPRSTSRRADVDDALRRRPAR